jgi:hypothetical protein
MLGPILAIFKQVQRLLTVNNLSNKHCLNANSTHLRVFQNKKVLLDQKALEEPF